MRCFNNSSPPTSPLFFGVPDVKASSSSFNGSGKNDEDSISLCSIADDPIHILNVAITTETGMDDVTLHSMFQTFVHAHRVRYSIKIGVRIKESFFLTFLMYTNI